jgi:hypothetical protein
MALSPTDRDLLDSLGVGNVRQKLDHAGPGQGAAVTGLGPGFGMTRGDVEAWLAEKDRAADTLQRDTLWWAKSATWVGIAGIAVAIVIAAVTLILGK